MIEALQVIGIVLVVFIAVYLLVERIVTRKRKNGHD